MSADVPQPQTVAAALPDGREAPTSRGLCAGIAAGIAAAGLAWRPEAATTLLPWIGEETKVVAPAVTAGIAAAGGTLAAWCGWAVDSWERRLAILTGAAALSGTQSYMMAEKFAIGWEPYSLTASLAAGLLTASLLSPRGAGIDRWFRGRMGRPQLQRLTGARDLAFLLPDQREASVLTCRILNETALREQMPAREFLRLMEAFRQLSSRVLLEHSALLDAPESGSTRAFFGLPLAVENHADRACEAGLALAAAMKQFALDHMHKNYPPVECGTGITCGTLTAGVSGEGYRAAGDAVEQSRWLAGLNTEYHTAVLTDHATHRLAENTEDRPLEILNPPEGAAVGVFHLLATRGGLSAEALARRDAFRDAIFLLRAGHGEDALRRFEDAREGLIHEDAALERFVSFAEHQCARDGIKPPPPARPRARFSPRRISRP